MTEPPIIVVYCEGPPAAPHERFIVAVYRRAHTTATAIAALWVPQRRGPRGVMLRNVEHYGTRGDSGWRRNRWPCDRCGLDEQRAIPRGERDAAIFGVFDTLWCAGVDPLEISVRGLMRLI